MPAKRKEKKPEFVQRQTYDGKMVTLNEKEAEKLAGKAICIGANSFGCHKGTPHVWRVPKVVKIRCLPEFGGNRTYELTKEEAAALYRCAQCGAYMGCGECALLPQELFCFACKDHANDLELRSWPKEKLRQLTREYRARWGIEL